MLNQKQLEAVTANDRFIFLLAGAGTGKTTVLINRVERIINAGINPSEVLLISFTRKSADELKKRMRPFSDVVFSTTFHGFCYQMLKGHMTINLIDDQMLYRQGLSLKDIQTARLYKSGLSGKKPKVIAVYQALLDELEAIDFNDLEALLLDKMNDLTFLTQVRTQFKHILIDEFQDTSTIQFKILKQLISDDSTVFCVGDPDQSIYQFRGANQNVVSDYIKTYKAAIYMLVNNYRSNELIIKKSNQLIMNNYKRIKKTLLPTKSKAGFVEFVMTDKSTEQEKVYAIVKTLEKSHIKAEEIVILFRSHFQAVNYNDNGLSYKKHQLMSIHQSKGLEFDYVFIIGLYKDEFPVKDSDIEEERRLMYVAMTRAREGVYMVGPKEINKRSKFIGEIIK